MAITPPAPPQQQQQQQQQRQQQQQQENNSKKTNKNTTATATATAATTTTTTTTRKKQQQQQPQLENDSAEQIRRHVDAVLPTASCRKFRRLIPSHGSLRLSSLRRYDATVSLENFRRRLFPAKFRSNLKPSTLLQCYGFAQELPSTRSEAEVRSGLEAVDATTMLRFRSGTSVDAVPKQRFARAWRPSTLLRWQGFARELPSTRFRSLGSLRPESRRR